MSTPALLQALINSLFNHLPLLANLAFSGILTTFKLDNLLLGPNSDIKECDEIGISMNDVGCALLLLVVAVLLLVVVVSSVVVAIVAAAAAESAELVVVADTDADADPGADGVDAGITPDADVEACAFIDCPFPLVFEELEAIEFLAVLPRLWCLPLLNVVVEGVNSSRVVGILPKAILGLANISNSFNPFSIGR